MRIIFSATILLALALAGCSPGGGSGGRTGGGSGVRATTSAPSRGVTSPAAPAPTGAMSPPPEGAAHTVTFAVRGSVRRASVTYVAPGGGKHRAMVSPPWSRTFRVADGQSIDVNAHSSGDGELTCTLTVDGDLVKSATSSGDSATVDCGDNLGF